ncbi:MAG: adenine phosphoribosyltransferase [Acidimicrobiia bacterium]|nr:adenine phosphoribosyltransferase [Acidimicrobiia bacterium]
MAPVNEAQIKAFIRDIPDFPEPGIVFKDITPLLGDPTAFAATVEGLANAFSGEIDKVVGIEARGFIFGAPVATKLHAGFVPMRKPGKLPYDVSAQHYALEYGTDSLEVHSDAIDPGDRVLVVDDVLATGGTGAASLDLVRAAGADVVGFVVVVELGFLNGRQRLGDVPVVSLVSYAGT